MQLPRSLLLVVLLPFSHGLIEKALSKIQQRILQVVQVVQVPPKPVAPEPSFLERINLQSSTEPKAFQFQFQQLPDLLTASMPVSNILRMQALLTR
jgi:hypothetical protein